MKTKQLILTVVLLSLTFFVGAQEKYEFMIIEYNPMLKKEIVVSIDGKEFLSEKANYLDQEVSLFNATPLLLKVSKYQDEGWEMMNMQTLESSLNYKTRYFAFMKRKKA